MSSGFSHINKYCQDRVSISVNNDNNINNICFRNIYGIKKMSTHLLHENGVSLHMLRHIDVAQDVANCV